MEPREQKEDQVPRPWAWATRTQNSGKGFGKRQAFPAGMEHVLRQPPSGSIASSMADVDLGAQVELFVER